jgi:RNA polymerase sigma factor (TIGR02999 family)
MSEMTRVLSAIAQGDHHADEQLLPLVYDELRRLAAQMLAQEKPGQTLQATALVHEAYLRLVASPWHRQGEEVPGNSRGLFFAAAAEAMRRILVENARRKASLKRGGAHGRQALDAIDVPLRRRPEELLAVHDALDMLAETDPRASQLVKLRYFGGFTLEEAAAVLGIAPRTADNAWAYARAWLFARFDPSQK